MHECLRCSHHREWSECGVAHQGRPRKHPAERETGENQCAHTVKEVQRRASDAKNATDDRTQWYKSKSACRKQTDQRWLRLTQQLVVLMSTQSDEGAHETESVEDQMVAR